MNKSFRKIAIATTTFTCATLFSFGWSEQRVVSLSIDSAQARVGRPLTPVSVAGVARRNHRRAAYGYGAGVVGAGVAAAAIGTAAAAATSPWGYDDSGPYEHSGGYAASAYHSGPSAYADSYADSDHSAYARSGPYAASAYYGGGYYADSPWGAYECQPHHTYECHPYSEAWH
jgi:hypothetical protein